MGVIACFRCARLTEWNFGDLDVTIELAIPDDVTTTLGEGIGRAAGRKDVDQPGRSIIQADFVFGRGGREVGCLKREYCVPDSLKKWGETRVDAGDKCHPFYEGHFN